jgi:hypothetical protein
MPSSLTSSLKSSLRGSISDRCMEAGSPPTLWCVLMVAEGPCETDHQRGAGEGGTLYDTDSITSG